jgi:sporulation protein YlmC with PRC-barrel domain
MKTLYPLSLVAALSLATTLYAEDRQTRTNTDVTAPGVASSPHQRSATSTTSPNNKTDPHEAKMVGAKVQLPNGQDIGEVKEVVLDVRGNASYAIISHGGLMGMGVKRTAVPWATVQSAMQENQLIMNRSQLERAPVLPKGNTPDASKGSWARDADEYWRANPSSRG